MFKSRFLIYAGLFSAAFLVSGEVQAQSAKKVPGKTQSLTPQSLVPPRAAGITGGSDSKKTAKEKFESLLDSNDLSKFRGYKSEEITPGWTVDKKILHIDGKKRGDDIITKESYKNFDMRFEWKVSEAGNSGVFYHVGLGDAAASKSGIEYQVLDDKGHKDGQSKLTSAGSIYALYPPKTYPERAVGKWNKARIVCDGTTIKHFLNDVLVAQADTSSEDWKKRLADSKFSTWDRFASQSEGHIALQDHGDEVWFRKIRIKRLPETEAASAGSGSKAMPEPKVSKPRLLEGLRSK